MLSADKWRGVTTHGIARKMLERRGRRCRYPGENSERIIELPSTRLQEPQVSAVCFCIVRTAMASLNYTHEVMGSRKRLPIAYFVPQLAMGWTVRCSNPGEGKIFHTTPGQPGRPTLTPVQLAPGFFPGGKAAGALRLTTIIF